MWIYIKCVFVVFFLSAGMFTFAQHSGDSIAHDHHDHHGNEIGIANSVAYLVKDKEVAYGLHLHYIHNFSKTKFGLGFGYERIFDEHKHNTFGIIGCYRPIEPLSLNISPGVTFEDNELSGLNFALHIEATYEFEINRFHLGPVLEFAYDPEDYHISLGLHIGIGF